MTASDPSHGTPRRCATVSGSWEQVGFSFGTDAPSFCMQTDIAASILAALERENANKHAPKYGIGHKRSLLEKAAAKVYICETSDRPECVRVLDQLLKCMFAGLRAGHNSSCSCSSQL
jgi:hypothetical protein